MSSSPKKHDDKPSSTPGMSPVVLMLATAADTTWRMFAPILGLLILGIVADKQFNVAPWLMLTGLGLGIIVAALLIRRQFKNIRQESNKK